MVGGEGVPRRVFLVGVDLQGAQQRREKAISRHGALQCGAHQDGMRVWVNAVEVMSGGHT